MCFVIPILNKILSDGYTAKVGCMGFIDWDFQNALMSHWSQNLIIISATMIFFVKLFKILELTPYTLRQGFKITRTCWN